MPRLAKLVVLMAIVALVVSACSPAFVMHLLASKGMSGTDMGGPDGVGSVWSLKSGYGHGKGEDRETALRDAVTVQPYFGTASYQRIGGRCPTNRFTSDFRIDAGGPDGALRYVQVFGPGNEQVSLLRSGRLGMFSDTSRLYDGAYFFDLKTRPGADGEDARPAGGVLIEAANRSITGLRQVDTLAAALDRRFVKEEVSLGLGRERPVRLLQAIGAPGRACTMQVTLEPDDESPAFPETRMRGERVPSFFTALQGLAARRAAADDRVFDRVVPGFVEGVRLARMFTGAEQVAQMDESKVDLGLSGDLFFAATDHPADAATCGTTTSDENGPGSEIAFAYGLVGDDGRTTIVAGMEEEPGRHLEEDFSWAVRAVVHYATFGFDTMLIEVHDQAVRQGLADANGQVTDGTADAISLAGNGIAFAFPARDELPDAILIEGFNMPVEGRPTVCDSMIAVPIPSTLPPLSGPLDTASPCEPTSTALCLNDWVRVEVSGPQGPVEGSLVEGDATAGVWTLGRGPDAFSLVQVVNGCELNGNVWALHASTGDVPHTVTFTDMRGEEGQGGGLTVSFDTWDSSPPANQPTEGGFWDWDVQTPGRCQ